MLDHSSDALFPPDDPAVRKILATCPPLEGERYKDGQLIFRQSSNQQKLMLAWLEENLVAQFQHETITFLSIGAGTGIFDEQVIRRLLLQGTSRDTIMKDSIRTKMF